MTGTVPVAARPDPLSAPLWPGLRRLVLFVLGVAVIIDALTVSGQNLGQLLVGTLLIGIVPVDELLAEVRRRRGNPLPPPPPASSEGGETD